MVVRYIEIASLSHEMEDGLSCQLTIRDSRLRVHILIRLMQPCVMFSLPKPV